MAEPEPEPAPRLSMGWLRRWTPASVRLRRFGREAVPWLGLLALLISLFHLYFQFFYFKETLRLTVVDVSLDAGKHLTAHVALVNGGTRQASVIGLRLLSYYVATPATGPQLHLDRTTRIDSIPHVLKPGDHHLITVMSHLDAAALYVNASERTETKGPSGILRVAMLGLKFRTMNSEGTVYGALHPLTSIHVQKDANSKFTVVGADPQPAAGVELLRGQREFTTAIRDIREGNEQLNIRVREAPTQR